MPEARVWIRESNLIEGVDDPAEDAQCLVAWTTFLKKPLDLHTIKWLHRKVMKHLRPDIAGKWRCCNVRVGFHIAPDFRQVPRLMLEWGLQHGGAATEDAIKAAHVAFETVHPFEDGNGRTGRMIMNWQRVKAGLEPLCIKASERQDYYRWFHD